MKITLLGNCQTKALSWYTQQLDASFDVKWICIDTFYKYKWAWDYYSDKQYNQYLKQGYPFG